MRLRLRLKRLLMVVTVMLMCCTPARSQQLQAALSHYSADEGMTSNTISDIIIDGYGYIWIASWNGLSRFDGFNFFNYTTGNTSGIPLLHNRIKDLYTDKAQNVWLRMYDGRVFVLNRHTDTIMNPLKGIEGYEDFKTKYPMMVSSDGDVYAIIDGKGIYKMRLENNTVKTEFINTGNFRPHVMTEGYKGAIWVGTDRGVCHLFQSKNTLESDVMLKDENISCMHSNGHEIAIGTKSGKLFLYAPGQEPRQVGSANAPISSIFLDSQKLIWFSEDVQGISRLNTTTGNIKSFTQNVLVPQFDVKGATIKETNGTVWMMMNHGGFGYYNREADEVEYFHNDPSNTWNLSNTVHAFVPLPEGVIWESTSRQGLEKLEILKNTIERRRLFEQGKGFTNEIRAIYYDRKRKKLLIGNKDHALAIFHADGSRTDIRDDGNGHRLGRIYGINQDHAGNYWLSCKGDGVIKMTPTDNSYSFTFFRNQPGNPNSLSNDNAYYTVEDPEGNIWVGTYGGGINIIIPQPNGTYRILNNKNGLTKYPQDTHQNIRTIALDKLGNVWAGSTDGIITMSLRQNKFAIDILKNGKDHHYMIGSNDVVCMVCDADSSMWIGTNGGGLSHTIGRDDEGNWMFENFSSKDGLPSDELKSLTLDSKGHVWFATDRVICSFDKERHLLGTFTIQDGVDNTTCSECGAYTMPNDDIFFGTVDGYYYIDHRKLTSTHGSLLKLQITDFFLNDAICTPRNSDSFSYYVPDSTYVKLPNHSDNFAFRFCSLNYQLQHRVHYQFMLEGYDQEWRNADKSRMAYYNHLPAGTYQFKVKAFLLESPDKFDLRTITVEVPPHVLLSTTAISIYLLLIAAIVLFALFWYHRQKKERERAGGHDDDKAFLQKQLAWLEANYTNTELTYDDLITQSTLGKAAYFNRLESLTGLSPKDFITDFRLKKALQIINRNPSLSVPDVALQVGFADPIYFTRAFKQKKGLSPIKYKEELKSKTHQAQQA